MRMVIHEKKLLTACMTGTAVFILCCTVYAALLWRGICHEHIAAIPLIYGIAGLLASRVGTAGVKGTLPGAMLCAVIPYLLAWMVVLASRDLAEIRLQNAAWCAMAALAGGMAAAVIPPLKRGKKRRCITDSRRKCRQHVKMNEITKKVQKN